VPNQFINNNTIITNSEPPANQSNQSSKSYAEVVNGNRVEDVTVTKGAVLCPYLMQSGICRYENCAYDHGELCELCDKYCLDPFNEEQRKQHHAVCIF
jgi:E3 ubiquitin-protein ligase makorin